MIAGRKKIIADRHDNLSTHIDMITRRNECTNKKDNYHNYRLYLDSTNPTVPHLKVNEPTKAHL